MSEAEIVVSKIDKVSGKVEGKHFVLNGENLTRDEFLEKAVEQSGYPIPLDELKESWPWIMLDEDRCSYGQVIELDDYNIQITGIDFDGLDYSFCDDAFADFEEE